LNLVADAARNTGVRVFLKEINRFHPNDNAIVSFYIGKTTKSNMIFKYGIKKPHAKIGLSRELRQTFIDRQNGSFQWRTLYYFDQQSSKRKERNIYDSGTKAQS
jgi:hypothetical protein